MVIFCMGMAIEVLSEISGAGISPRISFSHDLDQNHEAESIQRLDTSLLESSSDFDFCLGPNSFVQEFPSADELFSNGKILPIEIKKRPVLQKHVHQRSLHVPSPTNRTAPENKKRLKEFLSMSIDADDDKPESKSFWQFKRSSSLNCESSRSKGLIRSFQFLSRSNSTGSAPNPKPSIFSKDTRKQHLQKQPSLSRKSSVSSTSFGAFYTYSSTQKPPLKKNCGANYGNGVRVSPVLNLPQPFISSASVSFFGISSLFCNGKVKKKKR